MHTYQSLIPLNRTTLLPGWGSSGSFFRPSIYSDSWRGQRKKSFIGYLCWSSEHSLPDEAHKLCQVHADIHTAIKSFCLDLSELTSHAVGHHFLLGVTFGICTILCFLRLLWWGVGSHEILQTLLAEKFSVILEEERTPEAVVSLFRVFVEGWVLSQWSCGPRAPEPLAYKPWWRGHKAQGLFMRSRALAHQPQRLGHPCLWLPAPGPLLPASHSSGCFHEQSWPFAPESQAEALWMSQFLAERRLLWVLLFPFCSARGGGRIRLGKHPTEEHPDPLALALLHRRGGSSWLQSSAQSRWFILSLSCLSEFCFPDRSYDK